MDTKQLKKAYNAQLRTARNATVIASALREQIVKAAPKFKGPSQGYLTSAASSLASAKSFNTKV